METKTKTIQPAAVFRVLAIAGSLRRESVNRQLLEAAAVCAPDGTTVSLYEGLTDLPLFNEDTEVAAFNSGPVRGLTDAVIAADALLIATPEYNHSIPGVLKNAIDWLSRPLADNALTSKVIAVVGATRGSWGTRLSQAALRQTLFAIESRVLARPALYLARADSAFDQRGNLTDPTVSKTLGEILVAMKETARIARDPSSPP